MRVTSARCFLQIGKSSFEKAKVQFFLEKLKFNFSPAGSAHPRTSRHRLPRVCAHQDMATRLSHVGFDSTEAEITQYLQYTVYRELAAFWLNVQVGFSLSQISRRLLLHSCLHCLRFFARPSSFTTLRKLASALVHSPHAAPSSLIPTSSPSSISFTSSEQHLS